MKVKTVKLSAYTAIALTVLISGCSTQPTSTADSETSSTTKSTAQKNKARKSTVVQKRGGGYYKDDGPGDEIPDNLDEIPDAQPRYEPLHRFANRPYMVLGKSYVPATELQPYREQGVASWYGKKFHGQKTSIGEPYDMFSMTAAHPTLAIPSYVRVTNLKNGKSVVVRVTDRGPFHADRVIDLSYAAAYRLDYIDSGSTPVQVEAILPTDAPIIASTPAKAMAEASSSKRNNQDEIQLLATKFANDDVQVLPEKRPATTPPPVFQKGVFLQLGAFSNSDNAESLRNHLSRELDWLGSIQINAAGGIHRVHVGPYATRADAEKAAEKIRLALGYRPSFVTQ